MDTGKKIVFVIGVGRSGTTAVAELLNKHEDICIGIERYKFKFLRRGAIDGDEFEAERFFDFRETDTNILPKQAGKWRTIYDRMREKFPQARVCGDKIPHLFERFDACNAAFPEARWIYMLREIDGVASSWNARALNPRDAWPEQNDYRKAVRVWNEANALIRNLADDRIRVVSYEDFFAGDPHIRRALLDFLEVKPNPVFRRHAGIARRKYEQLLRHKTPVMLKGQAEHLAATADMETYRALRARGARGPGAQRSAAATA